MTTEPFLPPDGSIEAMMIHFHEMYIGAIKAGFSNKEAMQMVLEMIRASMQEATRKPRDET